MGHYQEVKWDLAQYSQLQVVARGQGPNRNYTIIVKTKQIHDLDYSYEASLVTPPSNDFTAISIPFAALEAQRRGLPVPDAPTFDPSAITAFGFQMAGGVYLSTKQSGPASLELQSVSAL